MPWDFETEPEFQAKLDWIDAFGLSCPGRICSMRNGQAKQSSPANGYC